MSAKGASIPVILLDRNVDQTLAVAGEAAGKDVLILSIDGGREIIPLIIDGKVNAVCECNPRFGPKALDTAVAFANSETIPAKIINPDNFHTIENAAGMLATAY